MAILETRFVNPEQFKKIRRLENGEPHLSEEEIWSVDGSILEAEIPDIGFIKKERNLLDSKQKRLERRNVRTEVVEDFCEEVSQNFHQLLIDSCNLVIPDEILEHLLESGFADPRFNLATGSSREKILKRMSLKERLSPKSSVLIFRLPKILTTYQLNLEELVLLTGFQLSSEDWFFLHNSLRKIIWEKIGKYQDEENMFFHRLNPKKQHHPTDYYYVWEVQQRKV